MTLKRRGYLPYPHVRAVRSLRVGDDFTLGWGDRNIYRVTSVSRFYIGYQVLRSDRARQLRVGLGYVRHDA